MGTLNSFYAFVFFVLIMLSSLSLAQVRIRPSHAEPQELVSLKDASVKELLAILSRPDKQIRVSDDTAARSHRISLWDRARSLLAPHLDEARPLLFEMLSGETADTRANALGVLTMDQTENLEHMRVTFVTLLADPSRRVRIASGLILRKVKDAEVENALLAALAKADAERPRSAAADEEIRILVQAICTTPLSDEKVIPALVRLLDESHSSRIIVWTTLQASAPLSKSERFGKELISQYWHILSTTEDDSLPYVATGAMQDSDKISLAYLRMAASIANSKARGYAAAELVSHTGFDPVSEKKLFNRLLRDKSPWVRRCVISSLCMRAAGINPRFQVSTAVRMCVEDSDESVKQRALQGVFDVLYRAPKDMKTDILRDQKCSVPKTMMTAFGNDALRPIIINQTGLLAGENWHSTDGINAANRTLSWWQDRKDESP